MKKFSIFNFQFSKNISNFKFHFSNSQRSRGGFTLLELVIAMVIMSILAVGLWSNFTTSIIKGKDSRRKQDLEGVAHALELYYADNKSYPITTPPWGSQFTNPNNNSVLYMSKVPQDPSYPQGSYCYITDSGGTYFQLYANLENTQGGNLAPTITACNSGYNYGISSSNTTP